MRPITNSIGDEEVCCGASQFTSHLTIEQQTILLFFSGSYFMVTRMIVHEYTTFWKPV